MSILDSRPLVAVTKLAQWMRGLRPLPAGAIPLASRSGAHTLICLMPLGSWVEWEGGVIRCLHPRDTQRAVVPILAEQLGGTTVAMAERLGVSSRTVEAWRQGKVALPIGAAYEIANLIEGTN